jgi:lysophospholipase L1-like esterase
MEVIVLGIRRRHLFLILFGLSWGLIVFEIGARLVLPPLPDRFFCYHPVMRWFHVPNREGNLATFEFNNHVLINSKGLFDREYEYEKPTGTFRILLLGDSFAEGIHVPLERTHQELLEARLDAAGGLARCEVVNGGVSSYGTDQELLFYETEGRRYDPDLVLLLFNRNDPQNNLEHKLFELNEGKLHPIPPGPLAAAQPYVDGARGILYDYSHAYRYALLVFLKLTADEDLLRPQPLYVKNLDSQMEEGWELSEAILMRLANEVAADGRKFAIVYATERLQVRDEEWQTEMAKSGVTAEGWDRNAPNKRLKPIAASLGVPYLDPTPAFRAEYEKSNEPLHFQYDIHWNEKGHALMAELLYRFLVDEHLLDNGPR